jgi:DNA polymerase-3 subunit gamma/tau
MTEIALYRKYRPQSFQDVMGQDDVVQALRGTIKSKKIAHAYLFCGPRGTGKTSIARIFAKELGVSQDDLHEMDAASNRGIDDIRALRDEVYTLPFNSQYKIYIIDEAHMLTTEAFNALLKTLEEPPTHVIFILATTEEHKMPETIVSRCQTFHFKKPSEAILAKVIEVGAKKEGYQIEKTSADLIAVLSEGSFRDAYGILQKVIVSSSDKKISPEEVLAITGAPSEKDVSDFIMSIEDGNIESGLASIRRAVKKNLDMKLFARLILRKIRAIMLLRYDKSAEKEIADQFSEEDMLLIKKLASGGKKINSKVLSRILEAYNHLGRSVLSEIPLELTLFDLIDSDKEVVKKSI